MTPELAPGDQAFPFELPLLDGGRRVRLADFEGDRPVPVPSAPGRVVDSRTSVDVVMAHWLDPAPIDQRTLFEGNSVLRGGQAPRIETSRGMAGDLRID